jgi:hypothetical protein
MRLLSAKRRNDERRAEFSNEPAEDNVRLYLGRASGPGVSRASDNHEPWATPDCGAGTHPDRPRILLSRGKRAWNDIWPIALINLASR